MTEDLNKPSDDIQEPERSIVDERPIIKEENIYHTRGCSCKPNLEDTTRPLQMCQCAKLATFDWTQDLDLNDENDTHRLIEVRFKNSRKDFYKLGALKDPLEVGDMVILEAPSGYDVGLITLKGPLAYLQYKKRENAVSLDEMRKVIRKARQHDVDRWNYSIGLEKSTQIRARKIANEMGLKMKINDVEYQGDGSKATFFYTADDRVDFRQLIKVYAEEFRVRIEMRQIGARQEAMHLGGIGSCGRELCCVTFLSNFHSVSTNTARAQQLSMNPQKLAGQCSKLKCCLNYEFEMYQEAAKDFPDTETNLFLRRGKAFWQKTDVFARTMYYSYADEPGNLIGIPVDAVHEIIKRNQQKDFPESLEIFALTGKVVPNDEADIFDKVVGQDELTRFDNKKKNKPNNGKQNNPNRSRSSHKGNNNSNAPTNQTNNPVKSNAEQTSQITQEKPKEKEPKVKPERQEIQKPILKKNTDNE